MTFGQRCIRAARGAAITAAAASLLVAVAPSASAATKRVCNAAFCNTTYGSGNYVARVVGTKIGANRGTLGFFEVFTGSFKRAGATTRSNSTSINVDVDARTGQLVCLRYFMRSGSGFVEVGTAQCTTTPI